MTNLSVPEPRVEDVCGPGVDPDFDQLIAALGYIARQKPKPLIDTIMFWRKAKGEAANAAKVEMNQVCYARNPFPLYILTLSSLRTQVQHSASFHAVTPSRFISSIQKRDSRATVSKEVAI